MAGDSSGGAGLGGAGGQDGGDAGAPDAGGAASGGDSSGPSNDCIEPSALSILGDYRELGGTELWLRDSGKAVTLTRVAVGKPTAAKLPELWQVVQVCPKQSALLLKGATGAFTRLDYLQGGASLTVCWSSATAATSELASALPPADRTNTIDAGCNGQPWTRFAKGGN